MIAKPLAVLKRKSPVRKIIHSLKLVDYLHVQADILWYNYYLGNIIAKRSTSYV